MTAVLFAEDYAKWPNFTIDTETKNKSFLRLSALYREMGVKNHAFPLLLLNKELKKVDPFAPNITKEEVAMVIQECKQNFWYYIREIARAPGLAGSDPRPFRANRGNIALYWLFFNHVLTILIQIRQSGKSFGMDTLNRYLLNVRCKDTDIILITKDEDLRSQNLARMKEIEDVLPFYLKLRTRNDLANTEELTIRALGNTYKGLLAQKSPKLALNLGRGLTSPIMQFDEGAFLFNVEISLPAALAAGAAARDIARLNDEPYGTIITTTAGRKDDRDGRFMYTMVEDSAIWNEKFLDAKNLEELEFMIRKASPKGDFMVNCTFSHKQLGLSDDWMKRTLEETRAKGADADRDFFNIWTSGTQLTPFSVEDADRIKASKKEDFFARISSPHGYVTRWYVGEDAIRQTLAKDSHVMSMDTSDAVGQDDIGMVLRNSRTGAVTACGNYNETNIISFCEWLVEWFVEFDNFVLIIERRSTGATICDYLILMLVAKGIDPFKRIYNKVVQEKEEYPDRFEEINKELWARPRDIYVKYKKHFGFATSGSGLTSRNELYGTSLINAAKYTGDSVFDAKLIKQILGLEIRNGRVDHAVGEHDDMAIAWVLSYWLLSRGKNLSFYGINPKEILANTTRKQVTLSPEETWRKQEQAMIRKEIEKIVEDLREERDDFVCRRLENKLRGLANRIILEDNETFSLDALMNSLHEERRFKRNTGHNPNIYGRVESIYDKYR